jgi:cellulose synthase/poly-beta-1,6-N-acetylglucosamine synthase-like glycosyltransferase
MLLDRGEVTAGDLVKAVALRAREATRIGDILIAHGWADENAVIAALCDQWNARPVPLATDPPDADLLDQAGVTRCLAGGFVPWRRLAGATVIVTSRPETFADDCAGLPPRMGPFVMGVATENAIQAAILKLRRTALARRAETRTPPDESVRGTAGVIASDLAAAAGGAALALILTAPQVALLVITLWSVITLVLTSLLKLAAAVASGLAAPSGAKAPASVLRGGVAPALPKVSMILPLFGEDTIARRMVERISRIDYPRELLDIIIVVEEDDTATRRALATLRLPRWMRTVVVPGGPIRTKPRALNFALDFCRGSIVGVWDAEDAPAPDQIHHVVRAFRTAPPEVACLQGVLDFYNRDRNWLSRCFAIEYAAWFRVVLPGLRRLGLVLPLGGTTLFFRRDLLEKVGAWDAHNVTEDADLGIRLARHGYRTDIIATVTGEEPNARVLPWVRQRSRWLKGYAMTWAVHMRDPRRLLSDLGWWRFLGVQVLFLGTLSQFALAPILWAAWLLPGSLGGAALNPTLLLSGLFVASEAVNMLIGFIGVRRAGHRTLMKWVPTMMAYFPLGTVAAAKALYEAALRPFYWDKTAHGLADDEVPDAGDGAMDKAGDEVPGKAALPRPVRAPPAPALPALAPFLRPRPAEPPQGPVIRPMIGPLTAPVTGAFPVAPDRPARRPLLLTPTLNLTAIRPWPLPPSTRIDTGPRPPAGPLLRRAVPVEDIAGR